MTAQQNLWADIGKEALAFLHGKGLTDDTIRTARLGLNPSDLYFDRQSWGLPAEVKENGKPKKLWLPAGLVIPYFLNGNIIRLRIRRPEGEPRYYIVPGSDTKPMTWNLDKKTLVILESELDGLLLNQEVGDLVGIVALGTATAKPDSHIHTALTGADLILVALDTDEAGAKASWSFWPETYGAKAKRWPCIMGKDPSDAWKNGLDLRAWIVAGVSDAGHTSGIMSKSDDNAPQADIQTNPTRERVNSRHKTQSGGIIPFPPAWLQRFDEGQLERLAIMTVDGRLSDSEALRVLKV